MRTTKMLASLAVLLVPLAAATAHADPDLIGPARDYVESAKVSKTVLGLMHTGASYTGADALGSCKVTDADDKVIPGEFAVKVPESIGPTAPATRTGPTCTTSSTPTGRFKGLRADDTTAILSQPFAVGGLAVDLIREAMLENLKGKPEEKTWAPIIKQADAKKLTEIAVAFGQP